MVEAAGIEPNIRVEKTQLTDSENASNSSNATIAKSTLQSLYSDRQKVKPKMLCSFSFLRDTGSSSGLQARAGYYPAELDEGHSSPRKTPKGR
jgi:hypothetical protein